VPSWRSATETQLASEQAKVRLVLSDSVGQDLQRDRGRLVDDVLRLEHRVDVAGRPPLRDGNGARAIVAPQRELVEELAHGVVEVLAGADASGHRLESLGKPHARGRMGSEPFRACGKRLRHG
jgi:hypothetical protein